MHTEASFTDESTAGSESLAEWMAAEGLDDGDVAEKTGKDRSTIYRARTGKGRTSHELIEELCVLSKGRVQPNSFFRRALSRAAAAATAGPGGPPPPPFSSTSSPPPPDGGGYAASLPAWMPAQGS